MKNARRNRSGSGDGTASASVVPGGLFLLLAVIVAVVPTTTTTVVGFVHPLVPTSGTGKSATSRTSTTVFAASSSESEEDDHQKDEQIAQAWRNVNTDMTRNDLEALEVLKELRSNLKSLVENLNDTEITTETVEEKETELLLSELATKEAMELAEKESRIAAAKAESEGITMQAKMDLQLQELELEQPAVRPLMADTPFGSSSGGVESTTSTTTIASEVEAEATSEEELVAELAKLDAQAKALRESIQNDDDSITPTTTPEEHKEESDIDPTTASASSSSIEEEEEWAAAAELEEDDAAEIKFLVAQLATRDAMEVATKQSRIDAARDASEGLTMQAKLDQQLEALTQDQAKATTSTSKEELVAELGEVDAQARTLRESIQNDDSITPPSQSQEEKEDKEEADAIQFLVAQLATRDAMEAAIKQSRIDAAKQASEGVTMQAKLDQQMENSLLQQQQELELHQQEQLKEEQKIQQLEEQEEQLKKAYLTMAKEMMEETTTSYQPSAAAAAAQQQQQERRSIQTQLESLEAAQFAVLMDMAKSDAVAKQAKATSTATTTSTASTATSPTTPPSPTALRASAYPTTYDIVSQEQQQVNKMKNQLTKMEAEQFALQIDIDKSNAVKADERMAAMEARKELEQLVASQVDEKWLDALQVIRPQGPPRSSSLHKMRKEEKMEVEQLARQIDAVKSNAVVEEERKAALVEATQLLLEQQRQQQQRVNKRAENYIAKVEGRQWALQIDIAKSNAVAAEEEHKSALEATQRLEQRRRQRVNKRAENYITKAEGRQWALQIDRAKSNAVKEDEHTAAIEARKAWEQQQRINKLRQNQLEAEQLAMQIDMAKSNAVKADERNTAIEARLAARKAWEEQQRFNKMKDERMAAIMARKAWEKQVSIQVDQEWSEALQLVNPPQPQPSTRSSNGNHRGVIRNGIMAKEELSAEAQLLAQQIDTAKSDAVRMDAAAAAVTTVGGMSPRIRCSPPRTSAAPDVPPQVIDEPVGTTSMAAETFAQEAHVPTVEDEEEDDDEDVVAAEPFFLADQNPNQIHEIIDVEALKSAAQEVQEVSELLQSSKVLQDSVNKQAIIQAAMEAANSVLKEIEAKEEEEEAQEVRVTKTAPVIGLEPLPQDVRNHQEDAKRFYFANMAAREISKKKQAKDQQQQQKQLRQQQKKQHQLPPPLPVQAATEEEAVVEETPPNKELSAAELAAKEHDEVDQQLRELFADVSLGFEEVKQSLARLMRSDEEGKGDDDELKGSGSNATAFDGVTP